MDTTGARIDVHQHLIPGFYREALAAAGIADAGGRPLPPWSPGGALGHMEALGIATAVLSVSTPGVGFLDDAGQATALARRLNEYAAQLAADDPGRFGFFATLPMPDARASAAEAERALAGGADGVVLLANTDGIYLGVDGYDALWRRLDERAAVAFVHPADLPAVVVERIPPFAADFLLDPTRAAYLLVRNGVIRRYPRIRFILSHAGGFVPYASHRMALAIAGDVCSSPLDVLEDFRSFWFDTALSSSPATLPTLLAFARPGHVLFGSDWPFAPTLAGQYFANGLDSYPGLSHEDLAAINSGAAAALFPRLGRIPVAAQHRPLPRRVRVGVQRAVTRMVFKLVQPN